MQELIQIQEIFHSQIGWHDARIKWLSLFLVARFRTRRAIASIDGSRLKWPTLLGDMNQRRHQGKQAIVDRGGPRRSIDLPIDCA